MDNPSLETGDQSDSQHVPDKQELKREVLDFVKLVVWFLVIFLTLRAYVIEGYEVQGESMEPTLSNNERILVLKLPHELSKFSLFSGLEAIQPNDIIVFESPDVTDKRYVKRVIAKGANLKNRRTVDAESPKGSSAPSEQVKVVFDRGDVYVNDRKIEQEYLSQGARESDDHQDLLLEPGEYYVLGDNRNVSKDSRSFDAVSDGAIIGKALIRFWPPSKISILR